MLEHAHARSMSSPRHSGTSKGSALVNVLPLTEGERVMAVIPTRDFNEDKYLVFATARAWSRRPSSAPTTRRSAPTGSSRSRSARATSWSQVRLTSGKGRPPHGLKSGNAARFNETLARPMGRDTAGVKGMNVSEKDNRVLAMDVARDDTELFVVTENGYGKRTRSPSTRSRAAARRACRRSS